MQASLSSLVDNIREDPRDLEIKFPEVTRYLHFKSEEEEEEMMDLSFPEDGASSNNRYTLIFFYQNLSKLLISSF